MKIGDIVKALQGGSHNGQEGIIITTYAGCNSAWNVRFDDGSTEGYYENNLQLINKKMNIKDSFTLAFKQEPEKSFRKTGITNGDDYLTDDGQKIFLSWLLKREGAKFKEEVVNDLLVEMEKDNK